MNEPPIHSEKPAAETALKSNEQVILGKLEALNQSPAAAATMVRIIAFVALAVGTLFLSADVWWIHRLHLDELVLSHATAQGQVVENHRNSYLRRGRQYFRGYSARVKFHADGGRDVIVTDWYGTNPPEFWVGQSVTVLYDRDAPENAVIDHGAKNYLALGGPLLMGFFILLGGVQRLVHSRPPSASPGPPPIG